MSSLLSFGLDLEPSRADRRSARTYDRSSDQKYEDRFGRHDVRGVDVSDGEIRGLGGHGPRRTTFREWSGDGLSGVQGTRNLDD